MKNKNIIDIPIYKDISFILDNSEALLIDIWGVLWDGIKVYPEAIKTLKTIKSFNIPVILLSNAPRKICKVEKKLIKIGIEKHFYTDIISSGEICREELISNSYKVPGNNYYFIGLEEDNDLLSNSFFSETKEMEKADFILLTGPRSFNDKLINYKRELLDCLKLKLPMISANPDKIIIRQNGKIVICAGELAKFYSENGGSVKEFGKPHIEIFSAALQKIQKLKKNIDKKKISIIGDGIETDIAGGNAVGINTVLVTDGILSKELNTKYNTSPNKKLLSDVLKRYQIIPDSTLTRFTLNY